jgi:hypothetical protein
VVNFRLADARRAWSSASEDELIQLIRRGEGPGSRELSPSEVVEYIEKR